MQDEQPREPRSPLKETIKRAPGQSAQEQLESLINDGMLGPVLIALWLVLLAGYEWFSVAFSLPRQPIVLTVFAVCAVGYAAWRVRKLWHLRSQLRLGIGGEREVGQLLAEDLPECQIFHDILCDGFNIDHAVIGPTGIYSVETKTRTKRGGPEEKVVYDGKKVTVAGHEPDRDPVAQAQANAKTLAKIIYDQTGQQFDVQPVVVFPGWYVETTVARPAVWVLHPKRFLGYVRHEPVRLTPEQIHVIAEALKRHQEAQAKSRPPAG